MVDGVAEVKIIIVLAVWRVGGDLVLVLNMHFVQLRKLYIAVVLLAELLFFLAVNVAHFDLCVMLPLRVVTGLACMMGEYFLIPHCSQIMGVFIIFTPAEKEIGGFV